jgi:hypothetical protein
MNKMSKYIALVLLQTENLHTGTKTYDETILSIEEASEGSAREVAQQYGKSCEGTYKNIYGETLQTTFLQVVEVTHQLREDNELYSRHFTDLQAYSRFEVLYNRNSLG